LADLRPGACLAQAQCAALSFDASDCADGRTNGGTDGRAGIARLLLALLAATTRLQAAAPSVYLASDRPTDGRMGHEASCTEAAARLAQVAQEIDRTS
jgi:hypothetical protein